jgi:hypothetical protein
MAQEVHLRSSYWSLGAIVDSFAPDTVARALETVRYFAAGAVAILGSARIRSLDGVIVVGTLVFLIAQFAGYFGSYVYLAAIAPVLCWRVDDWLRRALPEIVHAYGAHVPGGMSGVVRVPAPVRAGAAFAGAPPPTSIAGSPGLDLPRPISRLPSGS